MPKNKINCRTILRRLISLFLIFSITSLMASSTFAAGVDPQAGTLQIIVAGRSLPPTVTGELRGSAALIPVVSVAQELGYLVNVDYQSQVVTVRRKSVVATFIKQTGEITENNVTVSVVPTASSVLFTPNQSGILLPSEVISLLLDVSVVVDPNKGVARIEPRQLTNITSTSAGSKVDVQTLNYDLGVLSSSGNMNETLALDSSGRFGNSIYQGNLYLIGGSTGPYNFQSGTLTLLRPHDVKIQLGDFITGSDLRLMSSLTRGISYEQPLNDKMRLDVFAGKSYSGLNSFIPSKNSFAQLKFDTTILGGKLNFAPHPLGKGASPQKNIVFNTGIMYFNGPQTKGIVFDTGFRYYTQKLRLDAESAVGNFSGTNISNQRVNGFGAGIDIDAVYTPWKKITLQGQYEHYSPNFLSPQQNSQFTDRKQISAGITYRPSSRLSFGASASDGNTLTGNQVRTINYALTGAYDPAIKYVPRINASYNIINSSFGRLGFLRLNLTREYGRFRPYFDFTQTSGKGVNDSYSLGTGINSGKIGYFQVQQTFAAGKSKIQESLFPCQVDSNTFNTNLNPILNAANTVDANCTLVASIQRFYSKSGNLDWFSSRPFYNRIQIGAGIGYVENNNQLQLQARISTNVRLPYQQTFQFSYYHTGNISELRLNLSGPLAFWKKPKEISAGADTEEIVSESTIRGRVYIDNDYDHKYTPNVDKAAEGVMVILNGGRTAVSDVNGNYSFDHVAPGEQNLSVRMEDIRADLVPSTELEQKLIILPRTTVSSDILLVKSGSVTGRIFQDLNGNNQYDPGEPALADIHILSSTGKDTYTETDGSFLLSDLPPGEQIVYIDSRYLAGDIAVNSERLKVIILPGKETGGIYFNYHIKPREVEEKIFTNAPKEEKK